jgi:endonuclease YncB( thermonuclease family)
MAHRFALPLLGLCLLAPALAGAGEFVPGELVLDGHRVGVKWNDGDSFAITEGPLRKKKARLMDVNTLEDYGPVHRWGEWTRWQLFALAMESASVSASQAWSCTTSGAPDRYGRLLVRCPALARELVRQGQAMVFAVDATPPAELVAVQREAQKRGAGMWRKGVPPLIVSGAHSALEGKGYDRVVDTRTGETRVIAHDLAYETCQDVCVGEGKEQSCLVYVPFKKRYRDPPPCLTNPKIAPLPARPRPARQ